LLAACASARVPVAQYARTAAVPPSRVAPAPRRPADDPVVAAIGAQLVHRSEIQHFVAEAASLARSEARADRPARPSGQDERAGVATGLDTYIDRMLVAREARRQGVTVTAADIDRTIAGIANERGATPQDLYEALAREGISREDYRRFIQNEVLIIRL